MHAQKIEFKNEKQDKLTGYFFTPPETSHQMPILVTTGTGIKQSFYINFCNWLCEKKQHPVFIFDFNGIGESLFCPLSQSKATIRDWGQYDIPAAINLLLDKTGAEKIILVGHSVGGQLTGLVHNYDKIAKIVGISSSTGYVGNFTPSFRIKSLFFFNIFIPLSNLIYGYTDSKKLKMGENLPKEVAKEWGEYCKKNGYIFNAVGRTVLVNYFDHITCPFTIIYSIDDDIARKANVESLFKTFPYAQKKMVAIDPKDYDYHYIGHNLFFKIQYHKLWPVMYQYISD